MEFLDRLKSWGVDHGLCAELGLHLTERVTIERGARLIEAGGAADHLYVVEEGWLATQNGLSEGSTVITDIVLPGEIAGLGELAWDSAFSDTIALTPVRAVALTRGQLNEALETIHGAAGVILTLMTVRSTARSDRHAMTLRASGSERLLYLFVELHARQNVIARRDWLHLPLTQSQIADLVGLTNVHVSSLMKQLEAEEVIERRSGAIRLADPSALRETTGYRDRWGAPDFSWTGAFSGPTARRHRPRADARQTSEERAD